MKQYVIDQLRPDDYKKLRDYLDEHYGPSQVEGLYWIPVQDNLLNRVQAAHVSCQPFYFAVELQLTSISFELLIRTTNRVRCDCINYADKAQRENIIYFADKLFERLKILS
jgi:hypothetical protein